MRRPGLIVTPGQRLEPHRLERPRQPAGRVRSSGNASSVSCTAVSVAGEVACPRPASRRRIFSIASRMASRCAFSASRTSDTLPREELPMLAAQTLGGAHQPIVEWRARANTAD